MLTCLVCPEHLHYQQRTLANPLADSRPLWSPERSDDGTNEEDELDDDDASLDLGDEHEDSDREHVVDEEDGEEEDGAPPAELDGQEDSTPIGDTRVGVRDHQEIAIRATDRPRRRRAVEEEDELVVEAAPQHPDHRTSGASRPTYGHVDGAGRPLRNISINAPAMAPGPDRVSMKARALV